MTISGRGQLSFLSLIAPERSAHASIEGYLYQTWIGVERWLELGENEVLRCEGDEDLDVPLLDGGGRSFPSFLSAPSFWR